VERLRSTWSNLFFYWVKVSVFISQHCIILSINVLKHFPCHFKASSWSLLYQVPNSCSFSGDFHYTITLWRTQHDNKISLPTIKIFPLIPLIYGSHIPSSINVLKRYFTFSWINSKSFTLPITPFHFQYCWNVFESHQLTHKQSNGSFLLFKFLNFSVLNIALLSYWNISLHLVPWNDKDFNDQVVRISSLPPIGSKE
jgi:hypothetical protein